MSTYYVGYAESKVNGEWTPIGPFFPKDDKVVIEPVFTLQSAFREAYLKLCSKFGEIEICNVDMSSQIKDRTYCDQRCVVVSLDALKQMTKKDRPHLHQGYVLKHMVDAFECEEDSIEWWLTESEYDELDDKEKLQYRWYEWDDFGDEYGLLWQLQTKLENLVEWYESAMSLWNEVEDTRVIIICD